MRPGESREDFRRRHRLYRSAALSAPMIAGAVCGWMRPEVAVVILAMCIVPALLLVVEWTWGLD